MGPHYFNFRAITDDLLKHHALHIATEVNLAVVLVALLQDSSTAKAMGERARLVFEQQAGATARTVAAVKDLLAEESRTA